MATGIHGSSLGDGDLATPDTDKAAPTRDRIVALDFVRGAALFGILLMNINGFGLPAAYDNPTNWGGSEGANLTVWLVSQIGFEGTQRALFSMLFGAGVILFTSRLEAKGRSDVADIYLRRNMWLIVFGLFNGFILLWPGDILYYYGAIALLLYVLRNLPARRLLAIAIVGLLLNAGWNTLDNANLLQSHEAFVIVEAGDREPTSGERALAGDWEAAVAGHSPPQKQLSRIAEERSSGYWRALQVTAPVTAEHQSWWLYRNIFDIGAMMVLGMALFKMGVFTLEKPTTFYLALVLIGYSIGLAINVYEARLIVANDFSLLAFSQARITYDLGRLAMTAGHLGFLLLFARSGILPLFQHALACVGRMAFTNYLTHSVVCAIFFVGLGYFGKLERHELYYVVAAICVAQLVISPLWLRSYTMGPLEWLWRYLTYGKAAPLRKQGRSTQAI